MVSHLSLNYLSIDPQDAASPEAFRGLLRLYESGGDSTSHSLSRGVTSLHCRPDVAILPEIMGGFCRGIEVTLVLDDDAFSGNSPYLFAAALREFLSRYVGINSFARLVAMTKSMKDKKLRWTWAPKSGTRHLL